MARDLIPPPSPSGRPSPDAMRQTGRREPEPAALEAPTEAAAPAGPPPFRSRFGFITGALLGVCVAAFAALAVLLGTSPKHDDALGPADHWSRWFPPSHDIFSGPPAIAEHVQTQYRGADGKQLVVVHGGPFFYLGGTSPLPFAVRLQPADGTIRDLGSNGVFYTLAGPGDGGTLVAKSTPQRQRLLRREALELALYSFRYLDNITMFVALLPSDQLKGKAAKKAQASPKPPTAQAVFFRPGDLKAQLRTPLASTLKPVVKLEPAQLPAAEGKRVDTLTHDNLFKAHWDPQVDGRLYLVLEASSG